MALFAAKAAPTKQIKNANNTFQLESDYQKHLVVRSGVLLCDRYCPVGRFQYLHGGDQHTVILYFLSRNGIDGLRGIQALGALHQLIRCARHLFGLSCAERMGAKSDSKNPGIKGAVLLDYR